MKKKTVIVAIGLILIGLIYALTAHQFPPLAHKKTLDALGTAGLETSYIHDPYRQWQKIFYDNTSLDEDRFSSIEKITAEYDPFSLLMLGKLGTLPIENAYISGQWDKKLNFTGWNPRSLEILSTLPLKRINLNKTTLSFLTENYGGISVTLDLSGQISGKEMEILSHISSRQKLLSFIANAEGVIAKDFYNIETTIDEGKFETPDSLIKINRVNGNLNFARDRGSEKRVFGEIQAGGITLLGLPWQNAAISFEKTVTSQQLTGGAKSIGVEGIDLTLNWQEEDNKTTLTGTLSAENGKNLTSFLGQQTRIAFAAEDKPLIEKSTDVQIDFQMEDLDQKKKKIRYIISTGDSEPLPPRTIYFE